MPDAPPAPRRALSASEKTRAVQDLLAAEGVTAKSQGDAKPGAGADRMEGVLDGTKHEAPPPDPEPAKPKPPAKKPSSAIEAAEALGMSPDEFYNLAVAFGDNGPPETLGALKDARVNARTASAEIAEKEAVMIERESAIRAREYETDTLREMMHGRLSPERQAQVDEAIRQRRMREDAASAVELRRMMPEVQDPAFMEGFTRHLEDVGTRHGFSPAEIAGMRDPRLFTVLKELMDTRAALERLRKVDPERVKEQPRITQPQGRGASDDSAINRAKRSGRQADQVSAISSILRG